MIYIDNKPADITTFIDDFSEDSVEREMINILESSSTKYSYDSLNQLKFELKLRYEIIQAARALGKSHMSFQTFRESKCNTAFWTRMPDGGFSLKDGVKPSDGINDIYENSHKYGTECATAMQIVYYKALLSIFPEDAFNKIFKHIYLMNWHKIDKVLQEVGFMQSTKDYLPGDRRYFKNPDVNPETPEWQGENVIDLGQGLYYGHGVGTHKAETFIKALNSNRTEDSEKSAFLMDLVGRPDFKRLAALYEASSEASALSSIA